MIYAWIGSSGRELNVEKDTPDVLQYRQAVSATGISVLSRMGRGHAKINLTVSAMLQRHMTQKKFRQLDKKSVKEIQICSCARINQPA